ncbi:neurofibromin isoform X1 [Hydra vulgaris]|uniref:neurofibromin isoform X1 n=1 Tax=Hydra vulgaris TaxID=6087 RepID=UPI001F5EEC68|nr:neurofibromin isoform X1 [Hydra vulgaris]XP_047141767.1 neurofibromin isoform X2 [Hydra vulgaris]
MSITFKASDWINVELKRFKQQLPIEGYGKNNQEFEKSTNLVRASLVKLAKNKFQVITITLASYITDLNTLNISFGEQQQLLTESNMIILDTIKQCFEMNVDESSLLPDDVVKKHLLSNLCPLITQSGTQLGYSSKEMQLLAGKIVYLISKHHFSSVFERITKRIASLTDNYEDSSGGDELDLIQYLHVPVEGLIVLFKECCSTFKSLKKNSQQSILRNLYQAIWNWIENYPDQFTYLYKCTNVQLSELSEKLFSLIVHYVEVTKKKLLAWPLQVMLLLLSPESIKDASGSGEISKGVNLLKRHFLDKLKKSLSSNQKSSEYAVFTCIQMCKAATYINRQDNIACFLVSQVMNELKTMLFNSEKLFTTTVGLNINQLMVDLFVASFRINHRNNQHFEICFQPDSNVIFQLTLAKGIHQIVEENRLSWWPSVEVLYNRSAQIRNMFEQCVRRLTSSDVQLPRSGSSRNTLSKVGNLSVNKKKDDLIAPSENDVELLLWLVKLFHISPQIALSNPEKCAAEIQASSMQIMNGLVIIMMFAKTSNLVEQVSETLLSLHSPENIELWNPEAPMATFWEISSQIVYNVADRLLTEKVPNQLSAMRWLQKILKCRIQFIDANKTNSLVGSHNSICVEALSKLETMFLMCLWSTNTEKVLLAMKCFGLLFEEATLLSFDRPSPMHPTPLTTVYYKFSNEVRETGRTALHKRILSVLRDVNVQTTGNLKAWKLTLARWKKLTNALTNYPREELVGFDGVPPESPVKLKTSPNIVTLVSDDTLEIYLSEWCKMTGFLCSFGGICVSKEKDVNFFSPSSKGLEDNQINRFISEMLTLLVCENEHTSLQIRSAVRETLGSDLSVILYPSFFCLSKATTGCFFDPNGQVNINPINNIYSENLIYIIRTILENKSDSVAHVLPALPVEEITNALLKYLRSLVLSVQSLLIKTKMCQLVENIMLRRGDLSFHQEMKFRSRLVEDLTKWVLYASDESKIMSQEMHAISCGLDEAAMRAVAALLKGLPLQPENISNDITEAKSTLFLRHFTLFMNILNNCYDKPDDNKERRILAPHFVNLRAYTVQAMSNMLSANIDSGLMHSISLGYHEDPQTRATFLEVLTDILKQGTEFENLAETVLEDRFERIIQLVTNNGNSDDIPIVMALCNSVTIDDMDDVAKVLVNLFNMKGILHVLLMNLFKDEVEKTETQQTLFRGNTIASKVMSYSFKIYGGNFLQLLLGPLITEMIKHSDGKSYEVDSARLENNENIGDNTQSVIELANGFMDKVKELKNEFPMQLKSLCYCLNKAVQTRFPSSAYDAVASAVFLRFINPAIVSPDTHGIISEVVPKSVRRGLMLLSKILQNLANHLYFSKEAHMEVFNGFLENSFYRMQSFFRDIAVKPEDKEEPSVILTLASDSNVLTLHKLLWFSQEKMGRYLAMFRGAAARDPYEKLVTLLAHLGPPENQTVKLTQRIIGDGKETSLWGFEDFMAKHEGQNKEELEYIKSNQLFYGDGKSKAGRHVFYYIARRYMNDMISDEVFLYHILLTLQPVRGENWELVADFSHTSLVNRFKADTLIKAFTIIPESQLASLQLIYLYNINHSLIQYMELNERVMKPGIAKNIQKIVIIDKLSKLYEYIENVKLPSSTLTLENDIKRYTVLKITMKGTVILKVNPTSVQLQSPDKVKVLGLSVYINDVFYASEIEKASSYEDVLSLEFSSRTGILNFRTTQAAEIASYINNIHSRWNPSHSDKNTKIITKKKIRPKDVPGTLLNMSLINLGNRDPSLRLAAYNLLCSLTQTFNLQINERLLEAKGICIPSNCTLFITSISEQLAQREPNLTLEFLEECTSCFSKCDDESRNLCLNYMAPWLPNLVNFSNLNKKDTNKEKMVDIIARLIELTISDRKNYPFIQAQIWGNVGKIPDLLDVVIELFVKTSSTGGFLSEKAEVMADTMVTLASANVPLVSKKIFERFHMVIERTTVSPTDCLERHLMWDDIAIMARYLLMLSFNNSLDVSTHLADIFHVVILLVSTGPVTLRASIHGLVINALQSILTCSNMKLSSTTQLLIRTKLEDLSLQKFYLLFGISSVKSVPIKAFLTEKKNRVRVFNGKLNHKTNLEIPLTAIESITEVLLDVLESCINDCNNDALLKRWQTLCFSHCINHNPAIQPRCVVAMGYIMKVVHNENVTQMLEVLAKACGIYMDYQLIESLVMCLAKYQLALPKESQYHKVLFWVAIGVLQFGEQCLYPPALSLLENNLSVCHGFNIYAEKGIEMELMEYRNDSSFHWIFKQLDHLVGLSFSTDFHFALVALLVKGIRHPSSKTKSTALRIVNTMLYICSNKDVKVSQDKIEVNKDTLAYLAALMPVSEEIRLKLYNEKPTYSATLTIKRRRSKICIDACKSQSISSRLSSSGSIDIFLTKRRHIFESSTYNSLLDPMLLRGEERQALLIVLLATLVNHTVDDFEAKSLFEVLAEASVLYPEIFPICHSIINRKLCNVLSHSNDAVTLSAAQTIVQSISSLAGELPTLGLQKLTSIGFHGLHSFPGPFTELPDRVVAPQMFARYVDLVVNKKSNLTTDTRSAGQIFAPPICNGDVIVNTFSHSLTAIQEQPNHQPTQTSPGAFSVFKRVGSYSPTRRHRNSPSKFESVKEKVSSNHLVP